MNKIDAFFGGILVGIMILTVVVGLINHFEPKPEAIDVYQGNTTLKYEVVDGIAVDSVVIFKNK